MKYKNRFLTFWTTASVESINIERVENMSVTFQTGPIKSQDKDVENWTPEAPWLVKVWFINNDEAILERWTSDKHALELLNKLDRELPVVSV